MTNIHMACSSATAKSAILQLKNNFPTTGYVMPKFKHALVGIGTIYDAGCKVAFSAQYVTVFSPNDRSILTGWREASGAKIWRFSLTSHDNQLPPTNLDTQEAMMSAFSNYVLPNVEVIVHYLHAAYRFPVKFAWLAAIKAVNYAMWLVIIFSNAAKYFPESNETIKGHMVQTRQGFCSTKPKPNNYAPAEIAATESPGPLLPCILSSEIHIYGWPISKLYTYD